MSVEQFRGIYFDNVYSLLCRECIEIDARALTRWCSRAARRRIAPSLAASGTAARTARARTATTR